MSKYPYEFDSDQVYVLSGVTNGDGSDKTERLDFYNKYIGCTVTWIEYADVVYDDRLFVLWLYFKRDPRGNYINRRLHTSLVKHVEETENGIKIHTMNSIYVLEKTILEKEKLLDTADLIELYLSMDDDFYFCKGYYYDSGKTAHELYTSIHIRFTTDSCLVGTKEGIQWGNFVCRYFLEKDKILFYDTLYHQQDYSTPMLIHNTGSGDMIICFDGYPEKWTIKPGESKRIIPYSPESAD